MNEPNSTSDYKSKDPSHMPWIIGVVLASVAVWLLFDSVRVTSNQYGWFTNPMRGWWSTTTSTGIIFVPFIAGIVGMFYDLKAKWPRWLAGAGILLVLIEMFSRIHFLFNIKTSHLMLMLAMMAAGFGLILHGYFKHRTKE